MKNWLLIAFAGIVLLTCACTPMFLVGKEGKRGLFLGSNSKAMYDMLCVSGDLLKVLEITDLNKELKETFYRSNCSDERSFEKVKKIYTAMTSEQRKDIRTAFKKNGYSINGGACCGPETKTSGPM
jgi:hypothetical protein